MDVVSVRKEANREFLALVTSKPVPEHLIPEHSWSQLDDERSRALQDFVCEHVKPDWSTGIGMLEAMDIAVDVAEANGNLSRQLVASPHSPPKVKRSSEHDARTLGVFHEAWPNGLRLYAGHMQGLRWSVINRLVALGEVEADTSTQTYRITPVGIERLAVMMRRRDRG